jgi:LacI family transcriptional regulator
MKRVTLQMIADEVGLSKFAVSRALSGKTGVSDQTRHLISETARRLGYRDHLQVNVRTVGIALDTQERMNGEHQYRVNSGAQREAEKLGFQLKTHWMHGQSLAGLARDCDALIIVGRHSQESVCDAYAVGRPVVRIGFPRALERCDLVDGAGREAGYAVGRMLLDHGHREIAYVFGPHRYRGRRDRRAGLSDVMERHKGTRLLTLEWVQGEPFAAVFDAFLATGASPTAYFCGHDGLAMTVLSELLRRGIAVPRDVSVVGYGDYSTAEHISPALTSVRVPSEDLGAQAIRLAAMRLSGTGLTDVPVRIHVPERIVERASVAQVPAMRKPS